MSKKKKIEIDEQAEVSDPVAEQDYEPPAAANRRDARVIVMQALYAAEMGERNGLTEIDNLMGRLVALPLADRPDLFEFAKELLTRTWNNRQRCDEIISDLVQNWDVERITPIDKSIMRMGICELLYFEDIPPRVTINESIDIAKSFSTDKSGIFINGMLDAAVSFLDKKGALKKSGRGLV